MSGLKTWIYRWKTNGFRNAQGETVKNAGIIRCASIQLDIRARYPQRIRLQYVKGHSGDIGNDGADAMANGGTLLPAVKERDWAALERKLSEQLEQGSVETSDIEPLPLEVQDADDMENIEEEIPSSKMRKMSSGFHHEHKGPRAMGVAASSPLKPSSNLLPASSAPQVEKMGSAAVSPAKCSPVPASARPQSIPLDSAALSKSKADIESIRNKKISVKVIYALPPFVPVKQEEVNFDVSARLGFARQLFLTCQQDYADCLLDDEDLAKQLSD